MSSHETAHKHDKTDVQQCEEEDPPNSVGIQNAVRIDWSEQIPWDTSLPWCINTLTMHHKWTFIEPTDRDKANFPARWNRLGS